MNPAAIEERLRLGEDSVSEFKSVARNQYTIDPHDLAKAIVGLANTRGGHVILGVEDDGTPSGIGTTQQADALMRQVVKVCRDVIHPSIACVLKKVEVRGTPLLVVEVPTFSPDRPYRTAHVYYVRDANESREATRDELIRLIQSADHHFDEQPIEGASIAELDMGAVTGFLAEAYGESSSETEPDRYLRELRCLDESSCPTIAGVLFFAKDPARWLPDARISAVRFAGTAVSAEFADRREIEGRLPAQLDEATAFLDRHVAAPSGIAGWSREERGIPRTALREALLNALTHRDYRMAAQTRLFVFDDRVEIQNPGALLNRLTVESIRLGITQRRNPVIATLLNRLRKRENIGLGIPEMIRSMQGRGLPQPEFEVQGGQFRVVLRALGADAR